jgi:DNA-binding transcriptional ArsR family regulator
MPLEAIEAQDPLTQLVDFKISPVYEMMSSLQVLLHPLRQGDWAEEARLTLGKNFVEQLKQLYKSVQNGAAFFELAVDYADHEDVLGFIHYVRQMDAATFMYYLMGRVFTREEITRAGINAKGINSLLDAPDTSYHVWICLPVTDLADDLSGFQSHLTDIWEWYWTEYFAEYVETLRSFWMDSMQEKRAYLIREGGEALLEHVKGDGKRLPPLLPADMPYHEVLFVPLFLIGKRAYMFYGYGNVTVLYDSQRTEARVAEIEATKAVALNTMRALSDESRLKILQIIAHGEGRYNGKAIAAKMGLSASAVSRHLSQLKDGNLIVEESADNRNITYHLQKETLTGLSSWLVDYIFS